MKKLFFILLLGTFFFYSCDGLKDLLDDVTDEVVDSDGDGNDNDDEDDQGGQAGHDMVYLIDKIVETDGLGYKISFEYSYEYIESFRKYMPVREIFTDEEGSVVVDFKYDGNKIYRYVDGESEPGYTYTLDSRNRVSLMYEKDTDKTYSVEYEGDYIKSELCEYGERNRYSMNYEWEYGNLIVSSRHTVIYDEDTNSDGELTDEDIFDRTNEISYVRTEYPNNTNLDLNMRFCYSYDSTVLSDGPGLFGLTGERSEELCFPEYILEESPGDASLIIDEWNDVGLPLKITLSSSDIEYTRTYEITYTTK